MPDKTDLPVQSFPSASDWDAWLSTHHSTSRGLRLQIAKKASGIATVTYEEALDAALCYGWIDGQRVSHDANYFLQRFTPRRPKSLWSKRNVAKALELIASAKMQPAGLAEVEAAQQDGRWQAAYDSPKDMVVPEDFVTAVGQNPEADAFFHTLNKTNLYAIAWRLQTAKTPETRARRFSALLEMLAKGEKFH